MKRNLHSRGQSLSNMCNYHRKFSKDTTTSFDEKEFIDKSIIIYYSPNEVYEGYVNDKYEPHGLGNYYFENQDVYFGEFKAGKREGNGTYTYKTNECVYEGTWENDKKHGNGVFTFKNTNEIYNVVFEQDKLIKKSIDVYDNPFLDIHSSSKVINVDCMDFGRDSSVSNTNSTIMINRTNTKNNIDDYSISPQKESIMDKQIIPTNRKLSYNISTYSTLDNE